jgi:cytochrome c-type biogenesis protein CcmF
VLLGTLYPLLLEAMDAGKVSVGPPFFNAVFLPLMAPLVAAMAIGPLLPWKRGDLGAALARLWLAALAAAGAILLGWAVYDGRSVMGLLGFGLAAWLFIGTLVDLARRIELSASSPGISLRRAVGLPRATWGMTLAHAGLAVAIAGMTASSVWKEERIQVMRVGDQVTIGGYSVTFAGADEKPGANYDALLGRFAIARPSAPPFAMLTAEKRYYPVENQDTTEAAIRSTVAGDLYAVIGEPQDNGGYVTRLYFEPLVPWIWGGVGLMVLGGLVSLTDRRHRVGAPVRQSGRVPVAAGAGAE